MAAIPGGGLLAALDPGDLLLLRAADGGAGGGYSERWRLACAAPVVDACLADLEGLRQAQVYTACASVGAEEEGGEAAGRVCVHYPAPRPEAVVESGPAEGEVRAVPGRGGVCTCDGGSTDLMSSIGPLGSPRSCWGP